MIQCIDNVQRTGAGGADSLGAIYRRLRARKPVLPKAARAGTHDGSDSPACVYLPNAMVIRIGYDHVGSGIYRYAKGTIELRGDGRAAIARISRNTRACDCADL